MIRPITIEPMTAIGMSRLGFLLSPASWSACSKPEVGEDDAAGRDGGEDALGAVGANPSAAVKLLGCRPPAIATTKIVSSGTPTFHQVAALLVAASAADAEEVDRRA